MKFGVLMENMDDKFALILEVIGDIHNTLNEHTRMFAEINAKLERKADIEEVDALDRRMTVLERRRRR